MVSNNASANPWEEFQQFIQSEYDHSKKAQKEVGLMLEQSRAELAKLAQRNANITAHLQQIQGQFDTVPRDDIKMAYTSALDAQQRLLVMRGQIEKLQNDSEGLNRYVSILEKTRSFLDEGFQPSRNTRGARGGLAMLEKLINAQEAERQHLSREMHDGPAQDLSNFIVQVEIASRFFDMDPSKAKEELENLKSSAMGTLTKVRLFIAGLRPMMLDDLGLIPTVKRYVDNFKSEQGVDAKINVKGTERRFESYIEVMIFRAVQELMGNAVKHNQEMPVKPNISVLLNLEDNLIRVSVSDNGKGFDKESAKLESGLGLKLIKDRVEMLGGYMEIDSTVGHGAKITFQIPVDAVASQ